MALCLRYCREIVEELTQNDALLILGAGLGILEVISKFVEVHSNNKSLVFILNLSKYDIEFIKMRLMTNDDDSNDKLFLNVNSSISSQNRQNLYLSGGCIAITSRILVTDLLNNVIPFESITGILVHNAHQLTKSANLSFVLEIFRKNNRKGFIRGFSENASKFHGFTTLKEVMKRLFVSKVTIWPRFRSSVDDSFSERYGSNNIDTVELHLKLTDSMRIIQECIMEIIEGLLNELKKTTFVSVSITIENGLFNDFEYNLYVSFKAYWNKLSHKTKGLISDLINLKRLLLYVLCYDGITFYRHLMSMRKSSIDKTTNIPKSIWLYTDSAEKLFITAKRRVYQWFDHTNKRPNKRRKLAQNKRENIITHKEDGILQIHLEINPKWTVLMNVIKEIRNLQNEHCDTLKAPILIICKAQSTAKQLAQIISKGSQYLMNKYWKTYLNHIAHFNEIHNKDNINDKEREINCLLTHHQKLKDEEYKESQIDHYFSLNEDEKKTDEDNDPFVDLTMEEKKHNAELLTAFESDRKHYRFDNKTNDEMNDDHDVISSKSPSKSPHKTRNVMSESEKQQFAFRDSLDQLCMGLINRNYIFNASKIIIHSLHGDDGDNNSNLLLWQIKPEFVILYDSTPTFIRKLEVYHGYYAQHNLRVYMISYTSSIEEQIYLSQIRREKESFLKLINEKAELILPNNIDGKIDKSNLKLPSQQFGVNITATKRSQHDITKRKRSQIIVDIREFRSSTNLPLLLYRENVNVIPVTLKVGDYILSPTLCVERKCINDLFSSMLHGRLYDQILQIQRYYEKAILLIEFDEKKPFSLQNVKDIGSNINLSNIISKLVILTIHFNSLTVLWSRCPLVTTKIFKTLKTNRSEPDLNSSITITNNNNNDNDNDNNEDAHTPKDILRSLPGINHRNVDNILSKCKSLKDLCQKSKDEIFEMLGVKDGKLLYDFLHTNFFND